MGKVVAKAKIWNFGDELKIMEGALKPEEVRSIEVEGIVDSGATLLTLPEDIVERLGLVLGGLVNVTYADKKVEKRPLAYGAMIEILGRRAETAAVVQKRGTNILIGQTVLETMDLIVDPKKGILTPRPESPDMPLIELF